MWMLKYKFDEEEYLVKYKTRLIARDDMQYIKQDTYAAILAARMFRILMIVVVAFDLETRQYDAINAFANNSIDETIYCKFSERWFDYCSDDQNWKNINVLLLLQRTLYDLKQSSILWYKHLWQALIDMKFNFIFEVKCLFIFKNTHLLLFFFVNDIVLLYDSRYTIQVDLFQFKLFDRFEMRNLEKLKWFLSIHVIRRRIKRLLFLSQKSYIDKLIIKFNINMTFKTSSTLLHEDETIRNEKHIISQKIISYQQRVESIDFAAIITRSDVTHAASKLSKFLTNSSKIYSNMTNRTLKYLDHTKKLIIQYVDHIQNLKKNNIFFVSNDAFFADDLIIRYSSQDYDFKLFNDMMYWKTNKRHTITISSTEVELLALSATEKEWIWWTRFFEAIHLDLDHLLFI
jgi:hypothetical protein